MTTLKWLAVVMFAVALLGGLGSLFITSDKGGDVSPESPTQPARSPRSPDVLIFVQRAKQNDRWGGVRCAVVGIFSRTTMTVSEP
ncbi:hypothetical protein Q644_03650 [Brucella intermedia 229E]|uniref:Uncharacterized protein n=1 Tax=Brucella intermedia 229E TaxID=1337887 RepID=U4V7N8_9HYPH|nr:hypothetical protein Q644_03650 [Brucella intermedia 229E]